MDSIILTKRDYVDWDYVKTILTTKKSLALDTHLGENYITRMLKSKKITNYTITPQYVEFDKNKRKRGWVITLI